MRRLQDFDEYVKQKFEREKSRLAKYRADDGFMQTFLLIGVNAAVLLMWRVKSLQPFMWRWFTNSFAS
ncbi:unnamed protein product, partial [Gongylonema pulchrum]|uniref:2TM domain-containing protein n=1 Tax=Gongylonema pulchrum TaxID=637853 RepID=A0A183DMF5_9BILA